METCPNFFPNGVLYCVVWEAMRVEIDLSIDTWLDMSYEPYY